MLLKAI
jgi:hypothetical protein